MKIKICFLFSFILFNFLYHVSVDWIIELFNHLWSYCVEFSIVVLENLISNFLNYVVLGLGFSDETCRWFFLSSFLTQNIPVKLRVKILILLFLNEMIIEFDGLFHGWNEKEFIKHYTLKETKIVCLMREIPSFSHLLFVCTINLNKKK